MSTPRIALAAAADVSQVRALFQAYAAWLKADQGHDLFAEGFTDELAALPGAYGPPGGAILVAWDADAALGCVALRDLGGDGAEIKRLYVAPEARGQALGRRLTQAMLARARKLGHRRVVLDSLAGLTTARQLYRSLGFTDIAPYHAGDTPGLVFMGRDL